MEAEGVEFPPPAGTVLAGKYTVVRTVGRGGMAAVLEVRHEGLGTNVALKLLHPNHRADEEAMSRFAREARAVATLTSDNVARVIDVDSLPDGTPFMVLELLKGVDLGQELTRRGPLPIAEAVGYMLEACAGMHDAHRAGIVHRDLKPSNLFLSEDGDQRSVKVLDFGISKMAAEPNARMTATGAAFGTPLYMSPEQIRSVKNVDPRTDIWSLGVILFEALTGRLPFEQASATALFVAISVDPARPLHEIRPEVPRGLSDVLMRALSKSPDERYQDVAALAAALLPFGPPGAQLAPSLAQEVRRADASTGGEVRSRGRRAAIIALACVIAGLATLLIAEQLRRHQGDAPTASVESIVSEPPPVAAPPAPVEPAASGSDEPEPPQKSAPSAQPTARPAVPATRAPSAKPPDPPASSPPEAPPPAPTSTASSDDPKYL